MTSGAGPHPREIADALWLASEHPWLVGATDESPAPTAGTPAQAPAPPHVRRATPAPVTDGPAPLPEPPPLPAATPVALPVDPARHRPARTPATTRAAPPKPPPGDRALGRAWRPFRTTVASPRATELDEEATADLIAAAPYLPPVLRPAAERRWRAVLVVDTAPHMALWRPTVTRIARVLRGYGGFRDVTELALDTSRFEQATTRPVPPRALTDPTGRSVILVLTGGVAPAWRSGAAQQLLARWGRGQPVAVLHMLPQRLWHRTGLHPSRIGLRASEPWTAAGPPSWEPAEAVSALLGYRAGWSTAVPVPVLEARPEWLEPWARFAGGDGPRELELSAVLVAADTCPELPPLPAPPLTHAEKVAKFRGSATPEAFELAVRLAAVPLDLATMTEVQRRTLPRSGTEHLAEVLLSDLFEVRSGLTAGRLSIELDQSAREELLAYGSRTTTERVFTQAAELIAPKSEAARNLLSYLREGTATVEPVRREDRTFRTIERAVLRALSGPHVRRAHQLDELETNDMSVTALPGPEPRPVERGPHPPGPTVWGNVPSRNAAFTGRERLLDQLRESLSYGPAAVLPHALHGMGGVGKTQLAAEYVYRYGPEYDLVWWIPADHPARIRDAFVESAGRLGHSGPASTAVPAVLDALRSGRPYARWLLVFDNADSPEAVQEFIPSRFEGGPGGAVIVTSRNPQWSALARTVEVAVFERQESVALLRRRTPDITEDEAALLAETLGDLPLAVEQASLWRAETGMPPKEYVRLFEATAAELMASSPPTQYGSSIEMAWGVSLDRLREQDPGALQLLRICAYFAPEPIPRSFFAEPWGELVVPELDGVVGDPLRFSRAVRVINRHSLARIDHAAGTIQLHRLVQSALRSRMSDEEVRRFRHAAQLLLARNRPGDPGDPAHWPAYAALYPHVLASGATESEHPLVRDLVRSVIEWLIRAGNHNTAVALAQRVHGDWLARFGEPDVPTRVVGRLLHLALWRTGRYEEAAQLGERLVVQWEADSREPHHEELLRVKARTCDDLRARGDFRGALELGRDIDSRARRVFGPDAPVTLECAANLAVCLRANGGLSKALELDEDTFQRRAWTFGHDAPVTLSSRAAVARGLLELGRYREAMLLTDEVAAQARELYGATHPTTLRLVVQGAVAQRRAGYTSEAAEVISFAFATLTGTFGERSPDALHAALTQSIDMWHNGYVQEAVELAGRTYQLYTQLMGAGHPLTLVAKAMLAVPLRLSGRLVEARRLEEAVYERCRDDLGNAHPWTLFAAMNLATSLYEAGDPSGAHALDAWAYGPMPEVLGESHPMTLVLQAHLGLDLRALGDRRRSTAQLHPHAVDRLKGALGSRHPVYLDVEAGRRVNVAIDPMPL
ncbi:FxSxx-COOH system tetratricopeptide repeat protein [Streptomyces sp. GXMU-J15]|uniref:FxSxx-COOH system tetratricopeptide repeat protein n=1 Tax=Streptomyces fuscus TaxID=3048495 RepID=A0ABT7J0U2_9ACTN|nr:FxSxx-COOH system tetratricopeptide repeat protein [Streptomyces fuscus]MDL2077981.1 FxSxx-COOH system tetratricopeptide repeat protein [Streptomyces fuscus]